MHKDTLCAENLGKAGLNEPESEKMSELELKIGMAANPRTSPILDGSITIPGARLSCENIHGSELFFRQLKSAEFDVAEMSISALLMLVAKGDDRFIGLPVFGMRKFFHTGILVRRDSGIKTPADLRGKKVGVPEYQQTAMLWIRAVLRHEFGVMPEDMRFWMERTPDLSHAALTGFTPPKNVEVNGIPGDSSLGQMVAEGGLDAALLYLSDKNMVDRSRLDLWSHPEVRPLFADPLAEGVRYHMKTGLHPINHAMVIKRETAERHPELIGAVYDAFQRANAMAEARRLEQMEYHITTGLVPKQIVATQLLSHGISANRAELEAATQYSHEQELTPRRVALDEVFAPELMDS